MLTFASGLRKLLVSAAGFAFVVALVLTPAPLLCQTAVTGAGASFPAPIYAKWLDTYRKVQPGVQINYFPIGSGGGIRQILEAGADFGATDGPLNDRQLQGFRDSRGFGILHLPTVLGAAVPAYNLAGVGELNFTPDALVGIYLGRVAHWDDQVLRESNPKANLPHQPIVVLHRSEGSGTTYVWSEYLSKVSDEWKSRVGKGFSVNWPVGLSARGNDGIASLIAKTPCSMAYVELAYALEKHLAYGRVRNSSGNFVKADLAGVEAAAAQVPANDQGDFRFSITNAAGKDAYPIASFSWLLIPAKIQDAAKRKAIVDFVRWALTDGQAMTQELAYGRLPQRIVSRELTVISTIQ
ncbi:MAG TPA: phosphate ABC transporter substrate-binding protein PstS [Bryobacteraceae bacterium]|nr:phosphate ABC transporter substrate-binding protein PstS [Bryobacteraceae bacterium]